MAMSILHRKMCLQEYSQMFFRVVFLNRGSFQTFLLLLTQKTWGLGLRILNSPVTTIIVFRPTSLSALAYF